MNIGDIVRCRSVRTYSDDGNVSFTLDAPKGTVMVLLLIGREEISLPDGQQPITPDAWLCAGLGWAPPNILDDSQKIIVKEQGAPADKYCGEMLKRFKQAEKLPRKARAKGRA